MNILKSVSTLILATVFASSPVMAEGKKLADKMSGGVITISVEVKTCDADAKKFCPGLPANSQKSFMCLMAYEDKISKECKLGIAEAAMALKNGMMAIEYSIKSCEADADKHCLNVEPGEGRLVSCLKKNKSKLDKKCTKALKETGFWNMGKK
ncbi:MAG: hypothetical protein KAI84_14930 [Gammaproteobacteria bacterium]|nr:hypothetical protein [Gammaproteobacteria bacterium]